MLDNSEHRVLDVFFYGLYMDPDMLMDKKVEAKNPRPAIIADYGLKLGNRATLLRAPGKFSIGMLYSITHAELHSLYWGAGLDAYGAEALLALVVNESISDFETLREVRDVYRNFDALIVDRVPALCCNLVVPPLDNESNPTYREKLITLMRRLSLPLPDELLLKIH